MTTVDLALGLVAAAFAAFAWTSLKAREAANRAIRAACQRASFLLLDDTVALNSMRPARDPEGRLRWRRTYRFAYSDTGSNRKEGSVTLVGSVVIAVDVSVDATGEATMPR